MDRALLELVQATGAVAPTVSGAAWHAGAWVALAAVITPLRTALLHESFHGHLLPVRWNALAGRCLAALQALSWETVRWGHWTHHRWTRHPHDRPDLAPPATPAWRAHLAHAAHLAGGVYLLSLATSAALWLPARVRCALTRRVLHGDAHPLPEMRRHTCALLTDTRRVAWARAEVGSGVLLHVIACAMWGAAWPVLVGGWIARAVVVSLLDNVAHYGTGGHLGEPARNLALAPPLATLLLHGNLHEMHHRRPDLPWRELRAAHARRGGRYDGSYLGALFWQLSGPRIERVAAHRP